MIARSYARDWASGGYSSGRRPIAIVQLGPPNGGSPLPAIDEARKSWGGYNPFHVTDIAYTMLQPGWINANYNPYYQGSSSVPVYRVAGTFFPGVAEAKPGGMTTSEKVAARALRRVFPGDTHDSAVSVMSVVEAPKLGVVKTWTSPLIHQKVFGLGAYLWDGYGMERPTSSAWRGDAATAQNALLNLLRRIVDAESGGRRYTGGMPSASMPLSPVAVHQGEAATGGWSSLPQWDVGVAAGGEAELAVTMEGTSAVVTLHSTDGTPTLTVSGRALPVQVEMLSAQDGSVSWLVGPSDPGEHSLLIGLLAQKAGSVHVNVSDDGPSLLNLSVPSGSVLGGTALVTATVPGSTSCDARATLGLVWTPLHDDGLGGDAVAGDGIYSANVPAPTQEGVATARVRFAGTGSGGSAFLREGYALVPVTAKSVSLGTVVLGLTRDEAGRVRGAVSTLPVSSSRDCTAVVDVEIVDSSGSAVGQFGDTVFCPSGSSQIITVTVSADQLMSGVRSDGPLSVSRVCLRQEVDGIPQPVAVLKDAAQSEALLKSEIAVSFCRMAIGASPTSATPQVIAGEASCATSAITWVQYSIDNGAVWHAADPGDVAFDSGSEQFSFSVNATDGPVEVSARVIDVDGDVVASSDAVAYLVDQTAPSVTPRVSTSEWTRDDVLFSVEATDGLGSGVEFVRCTTSDGEEWDYSVPTILSTEGSRRVSVTAADYAGNRGATRSVDVRIDRTAPQFSVAINGDNTAAASVNLSVGDLLSGVTSFSYQVDLGATVLVPGTSATTPLTTSPGLHTVLYSASDAAGNLRTGSVSFTVTAPPVTYMITPSAGLHGSISPNTVQTVADGSNITFTITAGSGYQIDDVLVDGTSVGAVGTYAFSDVSANRTISASFKVGTAPTKVHVWRFRYTAAVGNYLWTSDPAECETVKATLAGTWAYEGPAYNFDPANPANEDTMWRFKNKHMWSYFYTADPSERAAIQADPNSIWQYEGPTTIKIARNTRTPYPVWRFQCLKNPTYLWTSDPNEMATIRDTLQADYKLEGIAYWLGK